MSNLIKNFLLVAMTSLSFTAAFAGTGELDQDPVNQTIQGTVVLRVDTRSGTTAMMQTNALTSTEAEAQALTNQNFQVVPQEKVKTELGELDRHFVEIDGKRLKPSQCYRLGVDPAHILFNTNCPEGLRQKIQSILSKYLPADETGS